MITKRPPRIKGFSYRGYHRYFLTTCTACRQPLFSSASVVERVLVHLRHCAAVFGFAVIAYCFMPDHLHVLVGAESDRSDFTAFVKRFKQMSGYDYVQSHAGANLWQPGYHERVLRHDDATIAVARYILANPVRAGLAREIWDYPFIGSDAYSLRELATAFEEFRSGSRQA